MKVKKLDKFVDLYIYVHYNNLPNHLKYNFEFNKKRFIYYYEKFGEIYDHFFDINDIHLHDIKILKLLIKYSNNHNNKIIKLLIRFYNEYELIENDNDIFKNYFLNNFKVIFKYMLNNKYYSSFSALKYLLKNDNNQIFYPHLKNKDFIKILLKKNIYPIKYIDYTNNEFVFYLLKSSKMSLTHENLINELKNGSCKILKTIFSKKNYYTNNPKYILNFFNLEKGYNYFYYSLPFNDIGNINILFEKYCIIKYGNTIYDYEEKNNYNMLFINKFIKPNILYSTNIEKIPKKLSKDCIIFLIKKLFVNYNKIYKLNLIKIDEDILKILKSNFKKNKNYLLKFLNNPETWDYQKKHINYKLNSYNLLFNYMKIIYENDDYFHTHLFKKIPSIYNYNKKILQKLFYYAPKTIYNLKLTMFKYNLYDSDLIDMSNVIIFNIPIDNESFIYTKKLMNYKNVFYNSKNLELLKNKEIALDIIKKYKYDILQLMPFHNNDNEIVLQSLKNNSENIKYVSLRIMEEYIKCNFNIDKLINYISNEI